jgi:hypothetical protein
MDPEGRYTGFFKLSSKWTASGVPEYVPGSATMTTVYVLPVK